MNFLKKLRSPQTIFKSKKYLKDYVEKILKESLEDYLKKSLQEDLMEFMNSPSKKWEFLKKKNPRGFFRESINDFL